MRHFLLPILLLGSLSLLQAQDQEELAFSLNKKIKENASIQEIKKIIKKGAPLNEGSIFPPLYVASGHNNVPAVKLLLEQGAKVDYTSNFTGTALNVAAHKGNIEVIKLLLAAKADPCIKNSLKNNSFDLAQASKHTEAYKLMASSQQGKICLEKIKREKELALLIEKKSSKSFEQTYKEAKQKAKKENKYLVIYFSANWCPPCKIMKKELWENSEYMKFFNQKAVLLTVDLTKSQENAIRVGNDYNVTIKSIPTLLVVDKQNNIIFEKKGLIKGHKLLNKLK